MTDFPRTLMAGQLALLTEVRGREAGGYQGATEQTVAWYRDTQSGSQVVTIATTTEPEAHLMATENRKKQELRHLGRDFEYCDGMWQVGPGPDAIAFGQVLLRWDATQHSLLFRSSHGTSAIRGAKDQFSLSFLQEALHTFLAANE